MSLRSIMSPLIWILFVNQTIFFVLPLFVMVIFGLQYLQTLSWAVSTLVCTKSFLICKFKITISSDYMIHAKKTYI